MRTSIWAMTGRSEAASENFKVLRKASISLLKALHQLEGIWGAGQFPMPGQSVSH